MHSLHDDHVAQDAVSRKHSEWMMSGSLAEFVSIQGTREVQQRLAACVLSTLNVCIGEQQLMPRKSENTSCQRRLGTYRTMATQTAQQHEIDVVMYSRTYSIPNYLRWWLMKRIASSLMSKKNATNATWTSRLRAMSSCLISKTCSM